MVSPPEVTCVVDVSVRRGEPHPRWVQVHSSQALRGDLVAAVTTAGARTEAALWPVDVWAAAALPDRGRPGAGGSPAAGP